MGLGISGYLCVLMLITPRIQKLIKTRGWNKRSKNNIRRGWTEDEKESVRSRQGGVCKKGGRSPPRWEYHHRNGN